jgi:DNA polymerase-3 subunit beta
MQVQQKSLHAALKRIQKAVPPKPTLYSLSNVHLQSNGTGLHLRAIDLELDMSTTIQSEGTLDVLIPYKSLLDTVASLSGTIDIEHVGRELRIRSGRSTIEMSTKLVEDFPPRPEVTDGDSFTMTLKDLQKAVNDLSYAVAKNDDRPILTGIRLDVQSSEVKMAVADGFRLAVHTTSCSADEVPILAVIPSRSLVAVSQSFPGPDVHFTRSVGQHRLRW